MRLQELLCRVPFPWEVAPVDSATKKGFSCGVLLLFGGRVFRGEMLRQYTDFRREGNFPESKLSGFCSGDTQNMQSTKCIPISFRAFSYSHGQGCQLELIKIPLKIPDFLLNSPEYNPLKFPKKAISEKGRKPFM
jgi:hypothetical protein